MRQAAYEVATQLARVADQVKGVALSEVEAKLHEKDPQLRQRLNFSEDKNAEAIRKGRAAINEAVESAIAAQVDAFEHSHSADQIRTAMLGADKPQP